MDIVTRSSRTAAAIAALAVAALGLAACGAKSGKGSDKAAGVAYLQQLFPNVPVQDTSARASLQTFVSGKGDAMLAYENDAIFAQRNNQAHDYTVPDSTILIEN